MAALHVRNVPDKLYGHLKQDTRHSQQQQLLTEIQKSRFVYSTAVNAQDSVSLLREDREK